MTEASETPKVSYLMGSSFKPEAHVRIDTIQHLLPFLWEYSIKSFVEHRAEKYVRSHNFVVITFEKDTTKSQMEDVVYDMIHRAEAILALREEKRKNHPSSKGLVRSGPNPRHENKGNNPFTNVPPKLRRQR